MRRITVRWPGPAPRPGTLVRLHLEEEVVPLRVVDVMLAVTLEYEDELEGSPYMLLPGDLPVIDT